MKEEAAVKALKEVKEVLDSHGITFWLDLGTLLGAIREGQFIEWDSDIDLGALEADCDKIRQAIPALEKRGYWVHHDKYSIYKDTTYGEGFSILRPDCHIELTAYSVNGEYAIRSGLWGTNPVSRGLYNLYLTYMTKGIAPRIRKPQVVPRLGKFLPWLARQVYCRLGTIEKGWVIPKEYFIRLDTIEFYKIVFNIPSQAEDYLRLHYGNSWRIPKRDWYYPRDDRTFRKIRR